MQAAKQQTGKNLVGLICSPLKRGNTMVSPCASPASSARAAGAEYSSKLVRFIIRAAGAADSPPLPPLEASLFGRV